MAYVTIKDGLLLLSDHQCKHGHPLADGYDILLMITIKAGAVRLGEVCTMSI